MSQMYFVITNSDGDTFVTRYDGEGLERRIRNEEHGVVEGCRLVDNAMANMPHDTDTNTWGDGVLIIKGEIVKPRPVERVTEWEID